MMEINTNFLEKDQVKRQYRIPKRNDWITPKCAIVGLTQRAPHHIIIKVNTTGVRIIVKKWSAFQPVCISIQHTKG
jgi:hypothetical protein